MFQYLAKVRDNRYEVFRAVRYIRVTQQSLHPLPQCSDTNTLAMFGGCSFISLEQEPIVAGLTYIEYVRTYSISVTTGEALSVSKRT